MIWLAIGLTVPAATAAIAQNPFPDWQQLELAHKRDGGTEAARLQMLAALPIGSPLDPALRSLATVGATCKSRRHEPDVKHCLIHQYSLLDGAADDIRWTITISASRGRIESLRLGRYVDRHGTA